MKAVTYGITLRHDDCEVRAAGATLTHQDRWHLMSAQDRHMLICVLVNP